jgi:hypothetical protein
VAPKTEPQPLREIKGFRKREHRVASFRDAGGFVPGRRWLRSGTPVASFRDAGGFVPGRRWLRSGARVAPIRARVRVSANATVFGSLGMGDVSRADLIDAR